MEMNEQAMRRAVRRSQPLETVLIPGALLKLETLAQLAGESVSTLYRAAKRGDLVLSRRGARCTRVTSEHARQYLARVNKVGTQ